MHNCFFLFVSFGTLFSVKLIIFNLNTYTKFIQDFVTIDASMGKRIFI